MYVFPEHDNNYGVVNTSGGLWVSFKIRRMLLKADMSMRQDAVDLASRNDI